MSNMQAMRMDAVMSQIIKAEDVNIATRDSLRALLGPSGFTVDETGVRGMMQLTHPAMGDNFTKWGPSILEELSKLDDNPDPASIRSAVLKAKDI